MWLFEKWKYFLVSWMSSICGRRVCHCQTHRIKALYSRFCRAGADSSGLCQVVNVNVKSVAAVTVTVSL